VGDRRARTVRGRRSRGGLRLRPPGLRVGDADVATRASFTAAVTAALDAAPGSALLDLSRLSFLSAGCARDLLRLAEAHAPGRVIVRCATAHARTLRQLGAARVPGLILTEADGPR